MIKIAESIVKALKNISDEKITSEVRADMLKLCHEFPIYKGLEY
ncbi:hypothetical protein AGMMS49531_11540 [Endomicrobiia bacterium]|nr:hypothetical protein AGMMS49531_11540 [Endomicrobiia bacterium]